MLREGLAPSQVSESQALASSPDAIEPLVLTYSRAYVSPCLR